jgi:hypothetical protein
MTRHRNERDFKVGSNRPGGRQTDNRVAKNFDEALAAIAQRKTQTSYKRSDSQLARFERERKAKITLPKVDLPDIGD